jgi:hypothetical protein
MINTLAYYDVKMLVNVSTLTCKLDHILEAKFFPAL